MSRRTFFSFRENHRWQPDWVHSWQCCYFGDHDRDRVLHPSRLRCEILLHRDWHDDCCCLTMVFLQEVYLESLRHQALLTSKHLKETMVYLSASMRTSLAWELTRALESYSLTWFRLDDVFERKRMRVERVYFQLLDCCCRFSCQCSCRCSRNHIMKRREWTNASETRLWVKTRKGFI